MKEEYKRRVFKFNSGVKIEVELYVKAYETYGQWFASRQLEDTRLAAMKDLRRLVAEEIRQKLNPHMLTAKQRANMNKALAEKRGKQWKA